MAYIKLLVVWCCDVIDSRLIETVGRMIKSSMHLFTFCCSLPNEAIMGYGPACVVVWLTRTHQLLYIMSFFFQYVPNGRNNTETYEPRGVLSSIFFPAVSPFLVHFLTCYLIRTPQFPFRKSKCKLFINCFFVFAFLHFFRQWLRLRLCTI